MKKTFLTLLTILSFYFSYSQEVVRTEITKENLSELFPNINSGDWEVNKNAINNVLNNSNTIYEFELVYKGKTILREVITKVLPRPKKSRLAINMYRFKTSFCIDYDILDTEDKLEIIEKYYNVKKKEADGKKYLEFDKYEVLKEKGIASGNYLPNDIIKNKLIVRVYKTELK
ncbi:hypothetical protein PG913_08550 [Tenacibaculum pacificus]|uniref:hypothetical protein n=1 Tax=Tenacibaculum pacificus TaxID=3018314 RepID=UPI0022F39F5C|nr:hypothetical protein [Tenacibaculum pacificus]WBX72950.1 hypothetical protein PG913_08550 [Tenacibaculum pacificus]